VRVGLRFPELLNVTLSCLSLGKKDGTVFRLGFKDPYLDIQSTVTTIVGAL